MLFISECIVKYPYKARYDDDISLCLGDVLFVNQVLKNGWWRGIKQNLEGFFPGSYVEKKAYNDGNSLGKNTCYLLIILFISAYRFSYLLEYFTSLSNIFSSTWL